MAPKIIQKRFDGSKLQLIVEGSEKKRVGSVLDAFGPGGYSTAAYLILLRLLALDTISWNSQGNITLDGNTEEGSNIVLLIKYALKNCISYFRLPGNSSFRNLLLNTPNVKRLLSEKCIKFLNSNGQKIVKPENGLFVNMPDDNG